LGAKFTDDDPAVTVLMPSDDLDLIYSEISSEESTLIETTLEDE